MTLLTTLARRIDLRGDLAEMWEPDEETCIPIRQLGAYAALWRTEEEVEEVRVAVPVEAWTDHRADAIVLAAIASGAPGTLYERCRPLPVYATRAAVLRLWGAGRIVRVGRGRYRLA